MAAALRESLVLGLIDAAGFVGGALLGWQSGRWLGFDVLAGTGWTANAMVGWLFLLIGCGAGKWASLRMSMHWRASRAASNITPKKE